MPSNYLTLLVLTPFHNLPIRVRLAAFQNEDFFMIVSSPTPA